MQDSGADLDLNIEPPEREEIISAIKSLKNGKAPWQDSLNAELFKAELGTRTKDFRLDSDSRLETHEQPLISCYYFYSHYLSVIRLFYMRLGNDLALSEAEAELDVNTNITHAPCVKRASFISRQWRV